MDNITWSLVGKQTAQVKKVQCKLIPVQCRPSLFQALGQWGPLKKRARDERGLPSLFLYQTPLVARRPAAFDKPQ